MNGAVGLLSTGNWHICQAAVETVLAGGALRPAALGVLPPSADDELKGFAWGNRSNVKPAVDMHGSMGGESRSWGGGRLNCMEENTASLGSGLSEVSAKLGKGENGKKRPKLLNLFG